MVIKHILDKWILHPIKTDVVHKPCNRYCNTRLNCVSCYFPGVHDGAMHNTFFQLVGKICLKSVDKWPLRRAGIRISRDQPQCAITRCYGWCVVSGVLWGQLGLLIQFVSWDHVTDVLHPFWHHVLNTCLIIRETLPFFCIMALQKLTPQINLCMV
jgi:hypothetical protein